MNDRSRSPVCKSCVSAFVVVCRCSFALHLTDYPPDSLSLFSDIDQIIINFVLNSWAGCHGPVCKQSLHPGVMPLWSLSHSTQRANTWAKTPNPGIQTSTHFTHTDNHEQQSEFWKYDLVDLLKSLGSPISILGHLCLVTVGL